MAGDTQALVELELLRAAVLADRALAAALLEIWRPEAFAERLAAETGSRGIRLDAGQIVALLNTGLDNADIDIITPPPGWLPAKVTEHAGESVVDWVCFGARRLTEPFYEESLGGVASLPFNRLFRLRTPLAALAAPPVAPAGFIFHMSRCGSTLLAQMLAASAANIVVSEAAPIDAVVRLDCERAGLDQARHAQRLAAIVGAFGPSDGGLRLFVKLDSWHACALPLFRRAFPTTPWVFLYREPAEVLVSLMRRRGMHLAPDLVAPSFFGIDWEGEALDETYAARVLAAICEAAAAHRSDSGLLVNYSELPQALAGRILPHFGVDAAPEELADMAAVAGRDAKDPSRRFAPDAAAKQALATPAIRAAVARHLAGAYAALEAARQDA